MVSIVGHITSGGSSSYVSGDMYKYIPYEATERVYISKTVTKKKKVAKADEGLIINLGGPFEETGGNDEAIGGGSQKVGASNQ